MGVMSCFRKGCNSIMCDTYVPSVGYVCYECQKEFRNYLKAQKDIVADSQGTIDRALQVFMEKTEKGEYKTGPTINVEEFFRNHTKS